MATFLGNTANKSLTDLSSLGNAKLQYRPFSINNGAVNEDSTDFYNIEFIGNVTRNYYNGDCIGFSGSDYLTMYPSTALDVSNGETWEMVWEVTTGSDVSTSQYFIGSAGLTNFYDSAIIGLYQGKFYANISFTASTGSALSSTYTATANTTYKVKLEFTGTAYNLYVNGELGGTLSSSTPMATNGKFIIGARSGSSGTINGPWLGAVNLKNSYINVNGNRWWNGIVKNRPNGTLSTGLTVYGSPTINNGNISNFSADNRANLPHYFDVSNGETWEMVWEVTTGSNTSTSQYFLGTSSNINANDPIVLGLYNGKFSVWLKYNLYAGETIYGTTVAAINTTYTVKAEFTGSEYNLYVNGNLEGTLTSSTPIYLNNLCVGIQAGTDGTLVSPWLGSVNVLNSYIKINDEMWWDGSKSFEIICAPCTITTCDGRTLVDSNTIFKDTTSWGDSDYYIFKDYNTGSIIANANFFVSSTVPLNVNVTGTLTDNNGVLSGFSASNYAMLPSKFNVEDGRPWEMQWVVTTSSSISGEQDFLGSKLTSSASDPVVLGISSRGTFCAWICYNSTMSNVRIDSGFTVSTNTTYTIKFEFTGTEYKLYIDGDLKKTLESSTPIYSSNIIIGAQSSSSGLNVPWQGSVNLNKSYINTNGNHWWGVVKSRWLDTSHVPYSLVRSRNGSFESENNYVCIGKCTVTSGRAHSIENYDFNLNSEGDWVYKTSTLTSYVDYPTSTNTVYDLSDYLPDDNCVYEVIVFAVARTGTRSGNTIGVRVTSSILTNYIFLTYAQTRNNAQNRSSNAAVVPIGLDRKLTLPAVSGTVGDYALYLRGYRRLGLNVYSA